MSGLATVVALGDRRASLEALRNVLAASIDVCDPERRAPLAKQLAETLRELANLPTASEVNPVDEIAKRRADRRAGAATPKRAADGDKRGSGSGRARGKRGPAS